MERDPLVAQSPCLVLLGDGVRPDGIATVENSLIILDQRHRLPMHSRQSRRIQSPPDLKIMQQGDPIGRSIQPQSLTQPIGAFSGGAIQHGASIGQHRGQIAVKIVIQGGRGNARQRPCITPVHVQRLASRNPIPSFFGGPPDIRRQR